MPSVKFVFVRRYIFIVSGLYNFKQRSYFNKVMSLFKTIQLDKLEIYLAYRNMRTILFEFLQSIKLKELEGLC